MLNHRYTSQLALLIGVKRMLSKGIQVDLSDFNAVQRKWLSRTTEGSRKKHYEQITTA